MGRCACCDRRCESIRTLLSHRLIAQIFLILSAAMVYTATTYGFGMREIDIIRTGGDLRTAMKVSRILVSLTANISDRLIQYFWISQPFYTLTNGFNKMAFVSLYYRIFPLPRFRRACAVLMAISIAWIVSYLFVVIFQCTPPRRVYDRKFPGTCINFPWYQYVHYPCSDHNLGVSLADFTVDGRFPFSTFLRTWQSLPFRYL